MSSYRVILKDIGNSLEITRRKCLISVMNTNTEGKCSCSRSRKKHKPTRKHKDILLRSKQIKVRWIQTCRW